MLRYVTKLLSSKISNFKHNFVAILFFILFHILCYPL